MENSGLSLLQGQWARNWAGKSTWDYSQPDRAPFPVPRVLGIKPPGREECTQPPPPAGLQAGEAQEPPTGCTSTTERQKEKSQRAHFELLSGRQNTLVPRALFHWGQQSREIRNWCSKGESEPPASALTQSCPQHQEGNSWPSYTDWPLPWNRQLIQHKLFTIGNKLKPTKTGGGGTWGTHSQLSQKSEQCFSGETQGSTIPVTIETPSRGEGDTGDAVRS